MQGRLRGPTPISGFPDRVFRPGRVGHGSSLFVHVRPFAPCRRLLRPPLSSVRSRRAMSLRRLLSVRSLAADSRPPHPGLGNPVTPFLEHGSGDIVTPDRSRQVRTRCFRAQALHLSWVPQRWASLSVMCQLARPPSHLCNFCPSPRTFHSGFLQTSPRGLALAFG